MAPGDTLLIDTAGAALASGPLTFPGPGTAQLNNSTGRIRYDTFEGGAATTPPVLQVQSPAAFNEGSGVTFTATVTPGGSTNTLQGPILWDISGNGDFGEASGPSVTLTWQQLEAFGITGPGSYQIKAEATNGDGLIAFATGTLLVSHVDPTIQLTGASSIPVGQTYTLGFTAAEAGNETVQGWTVNWGDGTTSTFGATVSSAPHVFETPTKQDTITVSLSDSYSVATGEVYKAVTQQVAVTASSVAVNPGGPYTVAEGNPLTLMGSAIGGATAYRWTINGVTEGTTATLPLTWATTQVAANTGAGTYGVGLTARFADGERRPRRPP